MVRYQSRRFVLLISVATVVAVCVCAAVVVVVMNVIGSARTEDTWAGQGTPVRFANEPKPSAPADNFVTGIGGLQIVLEARVIAAAGLVRPVASKCDTTLILPDFTCRVTYLGEVVTYQVTTQPKSSDTYSWQVKPDRLVVTRAGVEAAMWRAYATRATAMTCDSTLPERQLVAPGTTLSQRCYFTPTFSDRGFGKGTSNAARTVAVTITSYDGSLGLREKTR